jgi:hypothetical protein
MTELLHKIYLKAKMLIIGPRYAVRFAKTGTWMDELYLTDITPDGPVIKLFKTRAEAQVYANKWGGSTVVVEYTYTD